MRWIAIFATVAVVATAAAGHPPVAPLPLRMWAQRADGVCSGYTPRFDRLDARLRRAGPVAAPHLVDAALELEAAELDRLVRLPAPRARATQVAAAIGLLVADVGYGRRAAQRLARGDAHGFAVYAARRRIVLFTANREFFSDGAYACAMQGGGPSAYPSGHPHPAPHPPLARRRRPETPGPGSNVSSAPDRASDPAQPGRET